MVRYLIGWKSRARGRFARGGEEVGGGQAGDTGQHGVRALLGLNRQHQTIAQWDWRWRMLKGEATFRLVNVTVARQEELAQAALAVMEQARMTWETTELAASNKRWYSILKDAYSYYLVMKQDPIKDTRTQHTADLDKFIKDRGYTFMPSTHDMTRVVKWIERKVAVHGYGVEKR